MSLKVFKYIIFDVLSAGLYTVYKYNYIQLRCEVVRNAVTYVCNGRKIKGTIFEGMQIYHL